MSTKNWMSWILVAAMTTGGAGFALGGAVLGARAASREPAARSTSIEQSQSAPHVAEAPARVLAPSVPTETPAPLAHAPRPSTTPSTATGTFSIRRMQVTSGIDRREPIDHPSSFDDDGERVYAFVDVANPTDEVRHLEVTFENGQRSTGHVTLEVPAHSARFRTWAWTRLSRSLGEWTALVRDEQGRVLGSDEFEIR